MKVLTETIIKVSMSLEEYTTITKMISILEDICYNDNEDIQKNIEKQWAKFGVCLNMDDVLYALEILRDIEETNLKTE